MLKIKFEFDKDSQSKQTFSDIKQAFKVSGQEFAKAYHKRKVRSFQRSLERLGELEGESK